MNPLANRMSTFFLKVPDNMRRGRWVIWILFLSLTALMVVGLPRVKTDGSVMRYFSPNDPVRKAYDQYRAAFGGDENLYIVYKAKDGDVFSHASLTALQGIQEELLNYRLHLNPGDTSPLDHIDDVTTLINVSYLESANDTLVSRDFIGTNLPDTDTQRNQLRALALKEKSIPKIYFSEDSLYGGIVIETNFNAIPADAGQDSDESAAATAIEIDMEGELAGPSDLPTGEAGLGLADGEPVRFHENVMVDYVPFMKAVRAILEKPQYSRHLTFYSVGMPPFMDFVFEMILGEMGMIIIGMILLVILTTGLLYRSISAMLWTVLIIIFSLIWTLGSVGWSGVVMPDLMIMVVFFVIAVSVSVTIHILSGYLYFRQQAQTHSDALRSVYQKSGPACLLTSITTAIGFSSMLFVPIATMQRIGGATAVGIIYAFIITIFMLPLMLDLWSPVSRKPQKASPDPSQLKLHILQRMLRRVEATGLSNINITILLFVIIGTVTALGISQIHVESSNIDILRPDTSIRKAFDLVDEQMAGTDSLEILVDTGRINGMKDPRVLKVMEALQAHIETTFQGTVTTTYSIADVAKDAFQALNNNDPEAYVIPDNPDILSQTLFLFDNADPDDRRELVTDDYRIGRISVFSESLKTIKGLKLMESVDQFSEEKLQALRTDFPNAKITLTGMVALRMKMYDFVSQSQMISFGFTLIVISVIILLALGSVKLGLLALIPNLFPIVMVGGLMGFLDIPLDIHTLLVIPIVIGIAVDDTIHFMTHFQLERRQHGDTRKAIIHTFREVGQAILFTSIVLSIGFLMFMGSKNMGFVYFGILNAIAISVAVIADLFFLPAVLAKSFPMRSEKTARSVELEPEKTMA